ncbi:MAG: nicotinate-nucleotide adenylyltransferase [Gemmatimonadales bacterium]
MRIGIFGGSFDPIHHGHLIAAVTLREALELDEVRFVVAREQPLKPQGHGAPPEHRGRMTELAVEGTRGLCLDRSELDRPGPSYTVDTLRELQAALPGAELVLLLGSDAAAELPRWREPEVVQSLARVAVFGRGAGSEAVWVPRVEISSTEIRARARAGRPIRYWVPEAVADYIAAHRLYGAG